MIISSWYHSAERCSVILHYHHATDLTVEQQIGLMLWSILVHFKMLSSTVFLPRHVCLWLSDSLSFKKSSGWQIIVHFVTHCSLGSHRTGWTMFPALQPFPGDFTWSKMMKDDQMRTLKNVNNSTRWYKLFCPFNTPKWYIQVVLMKTHNANRDNCFIFTSELQCVHWNSMLTVWNELTVCPTYIYHGLAHPLLDKCGTL